VTVARPRSEKAIEADIIRNLRMLGAFVVKMSQPRRTMVTEGTPDLLILWGRYQVSLWVEVKRPGGTLRAMQAVWHREAKAAGQHVVIASSTSDVIAALRELGVPIG
jgi:hypothetical protein